MHKFGDKVTAFLRYMQEKSKICVFCKPQIQSDDITYPRRLCCLRGCFLHSDGLVCRYGCCSGYSCYFAGGDAPIITDNHLFVKIIKSSFSLSAVNLENDSKKGRRKDEEKTKKKAEDEQRSSNVPSGCADACIPIYRSFLRFRRMVAMLFLTKRQRLLCI